jgi:hypothetical protein
MTSFRGFDITTCVCHDLGVAKTKSSFPLRFHDDLTLRVLRVVAKARRVSINTLIEEMIARELPREIEVVENEMAGTLDALRAYKGKFEDDWAAFAKAEGEVGDPIRAQQVDTANDPLGVNAVFA